MVFSDCTSFSLGENMKNNGIIDIGRRLGIEGEILGFSTLSSGHINSTFKVDTLVDGKTKSYIIQKINTNVFANPELLMDNILHVTDFVRNKISGNKKLKVLKFLKSENGLGFVNVGDDFYRGYEFVKNSETYDITDNKEIIFETGYAFGEFQKLLGDYPATTLYETIPNFHNTPSRFVDFENAINNNLVGRVDSVEKEIVDYLMLVDTSSQMYNMFLQGELPPRVTHNDTKCNNVLFDVNTKKHLCVIDLDTVMPGLAGFDFGDGIRFIGNSATEDERDLSKVYLDIDKFRSFTEGFLAGAGDVFTAKELDTLSLGAITMTAECGVRFLTDYLNGDTYFKINYPEHNLDRARCQLKLAQDMIKNKATMDKIVEESVRNFEKQK